MKNDDLDNSRVDTAVLIAKSIAGMVPTIGAVFAELIGYTIPNQRVDRIILFLKELEARLTDLEKEQIKTNKYALDLFEDGIIQAARALTEERNRYLAIFIKKVINVDGDSFGMKKRLLYILQEITDLEIDILREISTSGYQSTARKYYPGHLTVGQAARLKEEELHEYNIRQVSFATHLLTLERFSLLRIKHKKPDETWPSSNIDQITGYVEIEDCEVTKLGNILLYSISELASVTRME
jgi:hypothetical protein